jgi:hypoxanthine phosphoribosyltransferase
VSTPDILFGEEEIAARVAALAQQIVTSPRPPELMIGILVGAFVFAADLGRALARVGLPLPIEFLWLRSYGNGRQGGAVKTLIGASALVRNRRVLLVDGVLDHGTTLAVARGLLDDAGAGAIATAVVIDKRRTGARLQADYAAFSGLRDFVVGYGMDDAGLGRGLPYIAKVKTDSP